MIGPRPPQGVLQLLLLVAAALPAHALDPTADVTAAMNSITGRGAMAHITLLAAPQLEGRDVGSDGFAIAATYAEAQQRAAGLSGGGKAGAFRQEFRLRYTRLGTPDELILEERFPAGGSTDTPLRLGEDYLPLIFSAERSGTVPLVFAGYGIVAPEHGWDDYKGLDVRGKAVLVLRHEPREKDKDSPFDGKRSTPHARLMTKARLAQARGAAVILFVTDPLNHDDTDAGNGLTRWPELRAEEYAAEGVRSRTAGPSSRIATQSFRSLPSMSAGGQRTAC